MKILFVCTGNTCRSPMAEAIAKDIFKNEEYEFLSAGIATTDGIFASENSKIVTEENNLNLDNHLSKQLTREMMKDAELILTMTEGHKQAIASACQELNTPVFVLNEYAQELDEIKDPYGCDVEIYRNSFNQIKKYIEKIYEILK